MPTPIFQDLWFVGALWVLNIVSFSLHLYNWLGLSLCICDTTGSILVHYVPIPCSKVTHSFFYSDLSAMIFTSASRQF